MITERVERDVKEDGGSLTLPQRLSKLREEVEELKQSLTEIVHRERAISAAMRGVVEGRARVALRRRVYEESKHRLREEYEELQQVASSNQRRDDRLASVRKRNFTAQLDEMERECAHQQREVEGRRERLQRVRRELVLAVQSSVFPVQVDPLSEDDAGGDDYLQAAVIDCDTALDVDDGWVLSGVHCSPTPCVTIVTASVPLDGDYSAYMEAVEERRKKVKTASLRGAPLPPATYPGIPPQLQPYLSIPAGLQFTAQLVEILADILDTSLPYPLHRPTSILEYSNQSKRRRSFSDSVAKLDDNIIYLCFSQNVPLSAITPGHTLSNLMALVTHPDLGRQGAFDCHPDLAMYRGDTGGLDDQENEPPSLYTAELAPGGQEEEEIDSEGEEEGEKGEEEGWESVEVKKGREYESGYLDYMALGRSGGAGPEGSGQETAGVGLFGTLSSLLSSTFTRSTL